ncbi:hypothetical protein HNQ91_001167 [Filimonas zeae]|uniref:Competence protein CoiA-like family protein n=1 Tax=Filimonas zeae TaxID=1737353 RepID=A0A917MSR4_9BACT|nr:DUF6035 family protein [Filimonas zeae]MDR6338145.1 hypothetical protein [Filimonas zeae]GGH61939.1 hypothetical protein GCM10011379_11410 [Filimonas zeae]
MSSLRTIEAVLNVETGHEVFAKTFFASDEKIIFEHRRLQEEAIQGHGPAKFVCYYCRQVLKIRGGIRHDDGSMAQIFHFAHQRDSDECIIKTSSFLTKEQVRCIKYNGQKESLLHIQTKELIGTQLRANQSVHGEVSDVVVDQVYKAAPISKEWRKPDVRCFFREQQVVFEVQLSTDFISVITEREIYYRSNSLYILWVFKSFDTRSMYQRFVQKDILYSNNQNVYVLDEEAIRLGKAANDLVLHCYYYEYWNDEGEVNGCWKDAFIRLRELTFESRKMACYYFDSSGSLREAERSVEIAVIANANQHGHSEAYNQRIRDTILYADRLREKYPDPGRLISHLLSNDFEPDRRMPKPARSYRLTEIDTKFLKEEFAIGIVAPADSPAFEVAYRIAYYLFLYKADLEDMPYGLRRILNALLSLKINRVIGFGYKTILVMAHKIFESDKQYGRLFIHAMHHYRRYESLLEEDKWGKLITKIRKLEKDSEKPDWKELTLLFRIFPELNSFRP